ncbi:MAG: CocE/NonD family hydrolase [Polyangiaceae bacterium]|nr:CocE/NonD family hydrolase [Polyangiaceae bacterium]MCB9607382.1 CocE/NonD family hydrolase [Polyangiaceae bacterium]
MRRPLIALVLVASLASLSGCTDEYVESSAELEASFKVRETVEQLIVSHATPGTELVVNDKDGSEVARGNADELGSLMFRELPPGNGYRVVDQATGEQSRSLEVWDRDSHKPDQDFYSSQVLVAGSNYIETRDGTKLSVYITLPGPIEDGPYPTIVNYSGYNPSEPGGPLDLGGIPTSLCTQFPTICDAPKDPSAMIGSFMGYATVGVNVRGTGCSGGAYDFFETMQVLDGYDVIEAVAAQPWVLHGKVGMTGLSYPGISQLFVAQTTPPHLAAITPLSVIADTASSTLAPGGIYNDGFALSWAEAVLDGAEPYGQGWEQARVDGGDEICEENQLLHGQAVDAVAKALDTPFYDPKITDPLNPSLFAKNIDVPVFVAGAWQDEQTGGHFPALFDKFTNAPVHKFTVYNGAHMDGFAPQILSEWKTFLDIYVAQTIPSVDPTLRAAGPVLFEQIFGAPVELGPDRFADYATWEEAKAAYEAEDDLRVIFEVGEKEGGTAYAPEGAFEERFASWPIPGTEAMRFYLEPDGSLGEAPPTTGDDSGSSFNFDKDLSHVRNMGGNNPGVIDPDWNWTTPPAGDAIAFETPALDQDLVFVGHASADLYVRSTADDADIQVNVTEVLPSGNEVYVQSGQLRASQRKLASDATELRPIQTHLEADAAPLPAGQWELARVEILPFGHVFRKGSKIRILINTPGGNHARWTFVVKELPDGTVHSVAHSMMHPSSVVFSHLPQVTAPAQTAECTLRAQPCREYMSIDNTAFKP